MNNTNGANNKNKPSEFLTNGSVCVRKRERDLKCSLESEEVLYDAS